MFRLSVLLRTGDPRGALAAADAADRGWDAADPYIPRDLGTIRICAAMAPPARLARRRCRTSQPHAYASPRVPDQHRDRLPGCP
jgi:hypothetical protein